MRKNKNIFAISQRKKIFRSKGFKQALSLIMVLFMCLVLLPIKATEASGESSFNSNYIYLDVRGMNLNASCDWSQSPQTNLKMYVEGWGTLQDASGIQVINGVEYVYWNATSWTNTDHNFAILYKDWNTTKNQDYSRTSVGSITVTSAKGKSFYWDDSSFGPDLDGHPTYQLSQGIKKVSQAGESLKFIDMTETLGEITAVFGTDESFADSKEVVIQNGKCTVPNDTVDNKAYKYVKFKNSNGDLSEGYDFFNGKTDTYYYSIKDTSGSNVISYWDNSTSKEETSLSNKTLYIDNANSNWATPLKIKYNNQEAELSLDSITGLYSYKFPSNIAATTNTKITISDGNNNFRFMWDLSTGQNKIKLNEVAAITQENLKDKLPLIWDRQVFDRIVYFDSSQSKISFSDIDKNKKDNIPRDAGKVYYLAYNSKNTSEFITGPMTQLNDYVAGTAIDESVQNKKYNYTYQNIWSVNVPSKYDKIVFCNSDVDNKTPNNLNKTYIGSTEVYDIPANLTYPCFYVNLTDHKNYLVNRNRTGQFGELTDINTMGDSSEVIPNGVEKKEKDLLYLNTTFYDYYSDQELAGKNRQENDESLHRNERDEKLNDVNNTDDGGYNNSRYVNHRMFDVALSDYYSQHTDLTPLYTGHFQWTHLNSNTNAKYSPIFKDIAKDFKSLSSENTLTGLTGYSDADGSQFYYNNNSQFYKNSTVGMCEWQENKNVMSEEWKTDAAIQGLKSGKDSPYFNKEFLRGDNSLHTAVGQVYENVSFPFVKNEEGYWEFDSYDSEQSLRMTYDSDKDSYFLNRVGSAGAVYGFTGDTATENSNFFPFNDPKAKCADVKGDNKSTKTMDKLNYGFGCKIQLKFRLTDNGLIDIIKDDGTVIKDQPIVFQFSGDDDVYVYIDDELALDIGGSHGAVTGNLNFATKKATVSLAKNGLKASKPVATDFYIKGDNTSEHTLTMYYMERGYWESNMKITFNFPIQNDLQVEKEVKLPTTYDLFQDVINNINKIGFDFDIQNLATSGNPKEVDDSGDIEEHAQVVNCEVGSAKVPDNIAERVLTVNKETYEGQENVVSWDCNTPGSTNLTTDEIKNRSAIIIPKDGTLDISSVMNVKKVKHYMEFDTKVVRKKSSNISDPYIELIDSNNNVIKAWTSAVKYSGTNTMELNQWKTIQIDLDSLKKQNLQFNFASIKEIRFAYWDDAEIYINNIQFKSEEKLKATNVFGVDEANISDYGSIATKTLQPANKAKYALTDKDGNTSIKRISDGKITLKDKENATFVNQFRTGSYIYVNEKGVNPDVFDTTWTIYENGKVVNPNWLIGNSEGITSLEDVKGTTVNDGRIEKSYGTKPENSLLFRSYENPDNIVSGRNLKVKVSNKLKTGSIKILKNVVEDSSGVLKDKKFSFTIEFHNVAGMALEEGETISETFTLTAGNFKEIKGIPAGTEYVIYENLDKDVATDSIEINNPGHNDEISESNNVVRGIVVADEENVADIKDIIEFKNKPIQNSIQITKVEFGSDKTITDYVAKFRIQKVKDGIIVPEDINDDFVNNQDNFDLTFGVEGKQEGSTNAGVVMFDKLQDGTYIITEVEAPDGYIKLQKPFKVTVPYEYQAGDKLGDGITAVEGGTKADIKLNVYNTKGAVLPVSGLNGIQLYLLIGILIMLMTAGAYTVIKVKKSKKIS